METVNTDAKTSNGASEPFAAMQNAFSQSQQFWSAWGKGAKETLENWEKAATDMGGLQDQGIRRAEEAADEMAKLFKASLAYVHQFNSQMRDMSIDAYKRTIDLMSTHNKA
jgi:hypothetical protein